MLSPSQDQLQLGYSSSGGRRILRRVVGRVLWPFLRHQVAMNGLLTEELNNQRMLLESLAASLTDSLTDSIQTVRVRIDALDPLIGRMAKTESDASLALAAVIRHEEPLSRFENAMAEHNTILGSIEQDSEATKTDLERAIKDLQASVEGAYERIELGQRQAFARYHDGAADLRRDLVGLHQDLAELQANLEERVEVTIKDLAKATGTELDELRRTAGHLHDELRGALHERTNALRESLEDLLLRLARLDVQVGRSAPIPGGTAIDGRYEPAGPIIEAAELALNGGSADLIQRARHYFEPIAAAVDLSPALDLRAGRGEWLSVLTTSGVRAYGLRADPARPGDLIEDGLEILTADPLEHLRGLKPSSLGAVVGSGLVDSLSTEQLIALLELALLALRPGGVLLLEAVNPRSAHQRSEWLFTQASDQRPLPPRVLEYLVATVGFLDVTLRFDNGTTPSQLNVPRPERAPWANDLEPVVEFLNANFLGSHFYGVQAIRG